MLFASVNQLEFKRTTRRDDLISLSYLLLFLLNNCDFPCMSDDIFENGKVNEKFEQIKKFKKDTTFKQMVRSLRPITYHERLTESEQKV